MKDRAGIIGKYGPVWIILGILLLLYFSSTIPAMKGNRKLLRTKEQKRKEINALNGEVRRVDNLLRALEHDPITVENELRKQFQGAKREGEILVD